jgi:hypothetical protein
MGLGHDRTIRPFLDRAMDDKVVSIGGDELSSWFERAFLGTTTRVYNFVSRHEDQSRLGHAMFHLYDGFQRFPDYAPGVDLSKPTVNSRRIDRMLAAGFGNRPFQEICRRPAPILSSFYLATQEALRYTELPVYGLICDVEFNRVWLPTKPKHPRLFHLVPTQRTADRMVATGAIPEHIHVTGYPLPVENTGMDGSVLRADVAARIARLTKGSGATRTLLFCIGGAGAQVSTAFDLLRQLAPKIREGKYRFLVSCGNNAFVASAVEREYARLRLPSSYTGIVCGKDKSAYFQVFNQTLRTTDLLVTKPSELVFYCGLGLPLLLTSPLGHQETKNSDWILGIGAGEYIDRHRFDAYLEDGIASGRFVDRMERGLSTDNAGAVGRILEIVHGN